MISKGCEQCAKGGKMVIFVYGYCDQRDCFYCPLGENRKNVTDVYANERKVEEDQDIIREAKRMSAMGSSITGGEPQEVMDRTTRYISLLKDEFGEDHHVHLYTGITGGRENMRRLAEAGLDEIRFHPPLEQWGDLHGTEWEEILYIAREEGITPAFEIPGIRPETEFLDFLDEGAAEFCNINEFEMSHGNFRRMQEEGYELREGHMSAVESGRGEILDEMGGHEKVYFCTSVFKDAAQHRRRLKRMARNVRRPFDEITDDGTLVYGKTTIDPERFEELGVPEEYYTVKSEHVEVAWWLLEEMVDEGDIERGEIVEQYPTVDGTVVERTPVA
ncbi:radical SAM protein [Halapricum hydrolyticum]|uniref:Radical SAM protein n=1 Tax=Halapricum hydrolyticum TaxID=2979991 RepID=A0AAE3ICT7_9EURY|nr:radical SAM protein [Halapricum hydrolyticum]MCU4717153.1 radical SAM protein [Halapricum hydrolyticum]MCU4726080.1 radical SAM protein [Halapricum hydrolyticum]